MNTAEMWIKAQVDGKFYECINGDMAYSKDRGLIDKIDLSPWNLDAWSHVGKDGLDDLMNCQWEEVNNAMTIKEAEEKFGIKIIYNRTESLHDDDVESNYKEYLRKMNELTNEHYDKERGHLEADDILCDFLEDLGYSALVAAFYDVPKWYA